MPTVRAIAADALQEIGVLGEDDTMTPSQGAIALLRIHNQIDAWQADRLTLAIQTRTVFTLISGTSTVTLGPAGGTVTMQRPVWLNAVTYIIPATSPAIEVPIDLLSEDAYNMLAIKGLQSAYPTQCFYQTSYTSVLGSLFFWPTVTQNVQIALYTPTAVDAPVTLNDILTGPPGYQEAFMYQLALRLMSPFAKKAEDYPLLVGPDGMAAKALATIKRVNVNPGQLSIDNALFPMPGAGYNVLSDNFSGR